MNSFLRAACLIVLAGVFLPSISAAYDSGSLTLIRKSVTSWNSMRENYPEAAIDLSGADLKGRNLKGADLHNANLQGANLHGADLSDTDLRGASFDHASLKGALLFDADLREATVREADLEDAAFEGADLRGAVLDGAVMKQADLGESNLRNASLRGTDLRAANLKMADLAGCDLSGAYLWRAVLDGANLENSVVTSVTIVETGRSADPEWAQKNGAVLAMSEPARQKEGVAEAESENTVTESILAQKTWPINPVVQKIRFGVERKDAATLSYDVHQRELLIKNVSKWNRMRETNPDAPVRLSGAKLSRKVLDGADLRDADLAGSLMKRTGLADTDLRNADLREANLREAELTNADLRGADLRGAYLWRANLSWTKIAGIRVNSHTVFDDGKNVTPAWAKKRGAVFMDRDMEE
ncbi:MAG: hypothetical protein C1941_08970 [Prosthecochloris sp.]|nr:hypothetical protein [Prosthecochloris sp.]